MPLTIFLVLHFEKVQEWNINANFLFVIIFSKKYLRY